MSVMSKSSEKVFDICVDCELRVSGLPQIEEGDPCIRVAPDGDEYGEKNDRGSGAALSSSESAGVIVGGAGWAV